MRWDGKKSHIFIWIIVLMGPVAVWYDYVDDDDDDVDDDCKLRNDLMKMASDYYWGDTTTGVLFFHRLVLFWGSKKFIFTRVTL